MRQPVDFLWRPKLADVRDDMVLDAAFNGNCDASVTWNVRDFAAASDMDISVLQPDQFVKRLKEPKP
jgi:predicted nucleic acid-binding protein